MSKFLVTTRNVGNIMMSFDNLPDAVTYSQQMTRGGTAVRIVNTHNQQDKENNVKKFVIAGTGTRQLIKEPKEYRHKVLGYLVQLLEGAKAKHGAENVLVISGMAEGFDEALAHAAVIAGVPFTAAVPNKGYLEYYWGKNSQLGSSRLGHGLELLNKAAEVHYVCKSPASQMPKYKNADGSDKWGTANLERNEWMVDRADVIWAYNPNNSSGTNHCIAYAKEKRVPVFHIIVPKDDVANETPNNPEEGPTMNPTPAKMTALVKLEKLTPQEVEEITALLEKNILPHLQSDVSNYAKGRQRVWLPYEAPLGNQPFTAGLLDGEVWQWIVDRCAKHGFTAQVALISKGGNINPHGDTTYAATWAMGFNLGKCDWHIQNDRNAKRTPARPSQADLDAYYQSPTTSHLSLSGGEVFKFNCKHEHAVTNAAPDRWSINVWAIADGPAADRANIARRLEQMLEKHPEVQEFIEMHQPKGATTNKSKEDTTMNEASFKGTFLSNFWPATVMHGGIVFPTVENFYQAMKVDKTDMDTRRQFQSLSAAEAKKKGKQIAKRKDWTNDMALNVMLYGLRAKFAQGSELAGKLLATGDQQLVETNYWHDTFWGKCTCAKHAGNGENKLGILLMQVREELKNNGGGGTPKPTPDNPEEGPKMKAEQPQNNDSVNKTDERKETKVSGKPISVDKWETDMGLSVELKRSDADYQKEAGRSWFAVVEGKVIYPKKVDGVIDELTARIWLSRNGLCTMPEINTPEVKPTEKKEKTMQVTGTFTLPNGVTLNAEQYEAYDAIINGNGNMLLTGNAGTGKSFVLNLAIKEMQLNQRSVVVTATTGIAATHINGRTYHSALRMFPNLDVDRLVEVMSGSERWMRSMRNVELIVIDEISMMHRGDFVKLDKAFRQVFDSTKPFGGKRFCFVGDFLQIEPVDKVNKGVSNFVFMTKQWGEAGVKTYQLKQVVRQQDAYFAGFLNNVRQGIWTQDMWDIVKFAMDRQKPENGVVSLVATNAQADSINNSKMAELPGKISKFTAVDRNPNKMINGQWQPDVAFWDKNTLVPKELNLKVGAQVICLLNHKDLVNGDTGIVLQIDEAKEAVQVDFNRLGVRWIAREKFHQGNKEVEYRWQIPLKAAWAMTIHKSQGMTLDSAIITADALFADGQCYVGLSRVRSLDGVYLESFKPEVVSANEQALKFYGLPGNLRGSDAELHSNMPKGDDDPDGDGGVFPVDPTPTDNNDGGGEISPVSTHEEEIMEPTPINNEVIEQVTETVEPQRFAKVDKSPDATSKTPKEGNKMIKEYLVETRLDQDIMVTSISRVITNDPEYWFAKDKTVVIEEVNQGSYHYALLEHIFGSKSFIVNITSWKNPLDGEPQVATMIKSGNETGPTDSIFGWADFDSETIIRVKDHGKKGWSNLSEFGLSVKNSDKMTKRLAELVRAARGYKVNVRGKDRMLKILVLTHQDILKAFPNLENEFNAEKAFDGVSVMALEKAKDAYRNNVHMSRTAMSKILRQMDDMEITNHTLRVLTNINGVAGEIKGNVLTAKRAKLNARLVELGLSDGSVSYDIVTSVDNFKNELGTDGTWEIITLEAHHGPGMVKTNDQTKAQFFGIKGIFDPKELLDAFQTVLDDMEQNIRDGKDIEWTTMLRNERAVTESDKFRKLRNAGVNKGLNKMYATLNDLELDLGVSQTLMFMRANSIKKMFLSDTRTDEYGTKSPNWQAPAFEKKSFLYMPWAYRAYVMTKEVIFLAGYDIDLQNTNCGYHKETQTFAMPGKQWAETCVKLGGADLDDEIMVHIRKIVELDGSERLAALLIRTPNDWAEFDIVNVKVPGPVFVNKLDMPTINMRDLCKFNQTSTAGQLPSKVNGSNRPKPAVWDWASTRYNYQVSMHNSGGVGGQVKTKMLRYAIYDAPFSTLPCANEDMIDAIQQCKGDVCDLRLLAEWSSQEIHNILTGAPMDAYWWYSRNMYSTAKALRIKNYTRHLDPANSPIVRDLQVPRENMINETFARVFEFLKASIVEIEEIKDVFEDRKQEMYFRNLVTNVMKTFFIPSRTSKEGRTTILNNAAANIMARVVAFEEANGEEATNMHILRMARASYLLKVNRKNANHDKWLYTVTPNSDTLMTDYLFRAMVWYREKKI